MKFSEYKEAVKRTLPDLGSFDKNKAHMLLGITTELGEMCDIFKRKLAYGKVIDKINLKEEVGDSLWYVSNLANILEIKISQRAAFETPMVFDEENLKEELHVEKMLLAHVNILYNIITEDNIHTLELFIGSYMAGLAQICRIHEIDIEECMFLNIEKLYKRFPEKFSQDLALQRNLEEERKVLEGK